MVPAKRLSSGQVQESYYSYSSEVGFRPPPPFLRTLDGSQLVFMSESPDVFENYSELRMVPLAGGAPLVLAPNVIGFRLSADGSRVVYLQSNGSLYSRALGSGGSTLLGVISTDSYYGDSRQFMISPDGTRVLFASNGVVYSVSSTGGPVTLLGPGGTSSSMPSQNDFGVFSADGNHFFFSAGSPYGSSSGYSGFRVADLRTGAVQTITSTSASYQVTLDRKTAVVHSRDYDKNPLMVVQLSNVAPEVRSRTVDTQVNDFLLSPDGSFLVWRMTSGAVKAMTLPEGNPVQLSSMSSVLQLSPDGKRVLFTEFNSTSTAHTLNNMDVVKNEKKPIWSGTSPVNHAWYSANGSWVFFLNPVSGSGSGSYNPTGNLNVVDALGGTTRALGTTLNNNTFTATGTNSTKGVVLASSNRVLLFSDSTNAPRTLQVFPFNIGISMTLGASVEDWEVLPDGARVLFLTGGSLKLGQVSDGTSRVVAELVRSFRMSPDGTKVFHVDIHGVGRVTSLATNETRPLGDQVSRGYWLDNGQLVFLRGGSESPALFQSGLYLAPVP
jgi:Tol biopolymer transport system component